LCTLYLDESGDHVYGKYVNWGDRYLSLCGCIFEDSIYGGFEIATNKLKLDNFNSSQIIFVRRNIIDKVGSFWVLRDEQRKDKFDKEMLEWIKLSSFTLVSVVIDKKTHQEKYGKMAFHPYHYSLSAMMERYCGWLDFHNRTGRIVAEARGKEDDRKLKTAYRHTYYQGTLFRRPDFFKNCLSTNEILIRPKSANIAGLQIADMIAYPSKREILIEKKQLINPTTETFSEKVCTVIQRKYNRRFYSRVVDGYGKVLL